MAAWVDRVLGRSSPLVIQASAAPPVGPPVGNRSRSGSSRYGGSQLLAVDEAVDATPNSIQRIFELAQTGDTTRLIDLYKHARVKDDRLDAVCATRVLAVTGRPYVLRTPPGLERDPVAMETARRVERVFNEVADFKGILGHLAHGVLEHLAVLQHNWRVNARGEWVSQPVWQHPNRFSWRLPDVSPMWARYETGLDSDGSPVAGRLLSDWPGRFVVFAPISGRSDYPWMRGAMRSRVMPSAVKRMAFRWWTKMVERWGQPQVYAERSDELSAAEASVDDQLLAAMRALSSQWYATIPKGAEFKTIQSQINADLHRLYIEHQDKADAISILGQNLTTEIAKGGSYAAAKAHQNVRLDLLASDLSELGEVITDQWIAPMCAWNGWRHVPYLDFVLGWQSEITVQEYMAGLYTADEVRGSKGHGPEPHGAGGRYYSGGAPATKTVTGTPVGQPEADPVEVEVVDEG